MAAALLTAHMSASGVEGTVASAGMMESGVPATDGSLLALGKRGLDISGHRSHRMETTDVVRADLILAMERRHLREAAVMAPDRFDRIFTLREIVRRGSAAGPRHADEGLGSWLDRVGAGRRAAELVRDEADDDIDDPMGGPQRGYDTTAAVLDQLTGRFVELAFPAHAPAAQ